VRSWRRRTGASLHQVDPTQEGELQAKQHHLLLLYEDLVDTTGELEVSVLSSDASVEADSADSLLSDESLESSTNMKKSGIDGPFTCGCINMLNGEVNGDICGPIVKGWGLGCDWGNAPLE